MKIYRWNDEYWYQDKRNWLRRIRQWFIWVGGWEKANGAGWQLIGTHSQSLKSPAPIAILGHRAVWYSWGWNIRLGRGWLVYTRKKYADGGRQLYISKDGTPGRAFVWYIGAPSDVSCCR